MTRADLDEIKRLLATYRVAQPRASRRLMVARRRLEEALVEHVDDLIDLAGLGLSSLEVVMLAADRPERQSDRGSE